MANTRAQKNASWPNRKVRKAGNVATTMDVATQTGRAHQVQRACQSQQPEGAEHQPRRLPSELRRWCEEVCQPGWV